MAQGLLQSRLNVSAELVSRMNVVITVSLRPKIAWISSLEGDQGHFRIISTREIHILIELVSAS